MKKKIRLSIAQIKIIREVVADERRGSTLSPEMQQIADETARMMLRDMGINVPRKVLEKIA